LHNALELKKRIHEFTPSKYLTFSVHLDGQKDHHDFSVCREGGYDIAIEGIKEAVKRGFRVTPNSTFFDGADPNSIRAYFDEIMAIGVEGMVLSPATATTRRRTRRTSWDARVCVSCSRGFIEPQEVVEVQHVAAVS